MIRLAIAGVCGRMGSTILKLALSDPEFEVAGGSERKDHPMLGKGLDAVQPGASTLCRIGEDLAPIIDLADVVIDFTEPASTLDHFKLAADKGKAIVIGTTGLPQSALQEISRAAHARVVMSPNMSIGVNLMFELVRRAASALAADYDVEILELHHKWKKDAPSGTAVRLRHVIEAARPGTSSYQVSGRDGMIGERKPEEIGVFAIRGGDIVGEHTVYFAGLGERLEITHRASSRDNFARGALLAAKWLFHQPAGIYDMKDVLGLIP
ncbi:MAG TPA: 4-hydroxy-tetrahydrodipicolinate reductase [Syntrophorhabdales bacterium]|nr:4-hydroxy-tetrahydrodipicolinate reductase [Syntrophorhabdales bacterium]